MSLRNKIFFALLVITLPVIIVAFQNIGTVATFIRNSPGFGDQAGLLLEELLSIESKIEKLGAKMTSGSSEGVAQHSRVLSEVRTSFSIIENLLSTDSSKYPELEQMRGGIVRFAQIIERCHTSCHKEILNIQREQSLIDENTESLIRKSITTVIGDYRTLKEQIDQGNVRGEWSLLALLILLLGASYFLAQGLTNRIVSLEKATQGVLNGDLTLPLPSPSHDEVGELIRAFGKMRANLKNSMVTRRYLEALLNELGEGVIVTDKTGAIEVVNPAARKMLDGAIKLHPGTQLVAQGDIHFPIQSGNSPITITTPKNERRLITVTSAPLIDESEKLVGYVHGIRDVTEKIALEQNLASHRERLARGERIMALGTLGAIVAHKLSQPISATRLFLQQALREIEHLSNTGELKDTLSEALGEISRISNTVTKMMRIERNSSEMTHSSPSVDAVLSIRNVTESMSEAFNRHTAELTVLLPKEPVYVACREVEFEELIYCLITNALQASVPSKTTKIQVELKCSRENATISVSDNGSGISEQSIDSIFDCFFTTKTEENGTGLGLAIVRHIVESHGGAVRVSSEEHVGSTFVLELPFANGEDHAETYDSIYC